MFPEIPGDIFFGHMEMSVLETAGAFGMAGIKQILFCHKKHKFQEQNAGAKLVLVSAFFVGVRMAGVGSNDLIEQTGCLCCRVMVFWKLTGKGEGTVPQREEELPFQRIVRLK